MELIIVILLIYVIFRDIIREDVTTWINRKEKIVDEKEEKRREEFKQEFDKMMEYSVDKAIQSKRGGTDGE